MGSGEDPASLVVQDGRPDIVGLLRKASQDSASNEKLGVLGAGPSSLVNQVHMACCEQNRTRSGGAVLEFSKHAFEL